MLALGGCGLLHGRALGPRPFGLRRLAVVS